MRKIHSDIATYAVETCGNDRAFYPFLAYHFAKSMNHEKAFKYKMKAADMSLSLSAFKEGLNGLGTALEFADSVADCQLILQVMERLNDDFDEHARGLATRNSASNITKLKNIESLKSECSELQKSTRDKLSSLDEGDEDTPQQVMHWGLSVYMSSKSPKSSRNENPFKVAVGAINEDNEENEEENVDIEPENEVVVKTHSRCILC